MTCSRALLQLVILTMLIVAVPAFGQQPMGHEDDIANPVPPLNKRPPPPDEEDFEKYESQIEEQTDRPWGLEQALLDDLFTKADRYAAYTNQFTCDENARLADYDQQGAVNSERVRDYGYLLTKDSSNRLQEYRQRLSKDGTVRPGEIKDQEPFPPAYEWVFLFSAFNEPYFKYRFVEDRFDGFDWVLVIEFKGSLPFTDGKNIRQWEGTAIVDAVTHTPIEIRAEPQGQAERIQQLYDNYNKSFNVMGMRTAPKPLGYRANVQFRHRKDDLSFPTELRYDTFRAVSKTQIAPAKASVRTYSHYKIYRTEATPNIADQVKGQ